jgi:uncharacterized protein YndB with AHSA1/START domain
MKLINVKVSRLIKAKPAEVFDVWVDPKQPGGPWHGPERVLIDVKVDGLFYHCVKWEGREWAHYGRFVVVERGARLEHTWMSEATKGIESMVRVHFEPKDGGTEVTLVHENIPDDELGRGHETGWTWMLDEMQKKYAAR